MASVVFVGAKGGVGTTTVTVLHALEAAANGLTVRLTATGAAGIGDLAAILGVAEPAPGVAVQVVPGVSLADEADPDAYTVVDGGTDTFSDHGGPVYLVVRNDYMSLRRALAAGRTTVGVVLVTDAGRSLGRRDVADVLAWPIVAELAVTPVIACRIDAGLLVGSRRPRLNLAVPIRPEPRSSDEGQDSSAPTAMRG